MDYKHSTSLIIKGFLLLFLLSGCSEEVTTGSKIEPESLVILGVPLATIYYDQEIELEFGASGGDGVYRYRYIQNPEKAEDEGEDFVFNPLELEVENNDAAKPSFSLKGIIKSENGVEADDALIGTFSYQIEITDGTSTKLQSYEYKLEVNKITFQVTDLVQTEGLVDDKTVTALINAKKTGSTEVCDDIGTVSYEEKTLPNGVKVYPFVFDVRFSRGFVEPVELFYRFTSKYSDQLSERHRSNIGQARPNVDFLLEERSIIYQPGQVACVGYVNLLDDAHIEGEEELTVEFYDANGGLVDLAGGTQSIVIHDDEPIPLYETKKIIRNEGEKVVGVFSLSAPYKQPLSVQVSIDVDNTTASSDDYLIQPASGVVTIAPGDLEASFTISLLSDIDSPGFSSNSEVDEVISVVTDIDTLVDVTPYEITINEWPLAATDEIVGKPEDLRKALAIDVAESGVVSVLLEGLSDFNEPQAIVIARHRDGTKKNLVNSGSGEIVLAKQGVRVEPVKIGWFTFGNDSYMAVIANVDGLFTGIHRGEGDFIVAVYKLDLEEQSATFGFYTQHSVSQYGSNGHDVVLGAEFDDDGAVYIFGQTSGTEFDGVSGPESNKGGEEGFVYKLNLQTDTPTFAWDNPRFIGSVDQDRVVALAAGRSDVVVLAETDTTDKDLFSLKVSARTGLDVEEIPRGIISSAQNDFGRGVKLDRTSSGSYILVDSQSLLPDGGSTPTLTQDVSVLLYNAKGEVFIEKIISTSDADYSADIEFLTENQNVVVGGHTDGEFEGNQRKSNVGSDAFISVFSIEVLETSFIDTVFQFGTAGNDLVIDIENAGDNKFLVLWSEDSTSLDGTKTYRVSAFSSEGVMLSTQP